MPKIESESHHLTVDIYIRIQDTQELQKNTSLYLYLKLGFASARTTKFRIEMLTLYPIGSVISTLLGMIYAQNRYQMKANDL